MELPENWTPAPSNRSRASVFFQKQLVNDTASALLTVVG